MTGKIPKRKSIVDSMYIRDGSDPENDWKEYYSIEENPYVINPKEGFIVSCNNKINGGNGFHGIGTTIPSTARAVRAHNMIKEKIDKGEKIKLDFLKEMQMDVIDESAKKLAPLLLKLTEKYKSQFFAKDSKQMKVINKMSKMVIGWNGSFDKDSKAALVFNTWLEHIHDTLLQEYYKDQRERVHVLKSFYNEHFLGIFATEWLNGTNLDSKICRTKKNYDSKLPCIHNVLYALLETRKYLKTKFGTNEANWKWKNEQTLEYSHLVFSDTPLRFLFHRHVPSPVTLILSSRVIRILCL